MLRPTFSDLIKTSIKSIAKNKGRTTLTSLGIIIGVSSVILLMSIGNGLKIYITNQLESLGSNLVYIIPGKIFTKGGGVRRPAGTGLLSASFDTKDIQSLKRNLKMAKAIIPSLELAGTAKYRNREEEVTIFATSYEYGKVSNTTPKQGKGTWFTKEDETKKATVGILGSQTAEKLIKRENPLNKTIIVNNKNIKVIGVAEKKGGSLNGGHLDLSIYVPLEIGFDFSGNSKIQSIIIQAKSKDDVETIKKQAEKVMLKRYEKDSFSVIDQSQILTTINEVLGILTIALSGIAAISLLVGGIGIMNIMLVTVTERTREIGLRKAVGATPNAILVQFLLEAVILACLGGFTGIIFGSVMTQVFNKVFPARVTTSSILLAFGVSLLVGTIFGVAPARRASKLSPIEALRYE